ncbi:NAD(P)-dependent oxidoreductase [Actinomadura barringtoniae]|nr:NAD(P)-dependent oxidoreductase [Actinomadura barringtoniae]
MAEAARKTRVALLGLGNMGGQMASHLVNTGFPVHVYNRTRSAAKPLGDAGACVADTAAEAVAEAEVVLVSLADENAVRAVLFEDALQRLRDGAFVLGASTVSPSFAHEAAERLGAVGAHYVELCLLGNPMLAGTGKLRMFTAGDGADAEPVREVLDALANQVRHVGELGLASTMKLAFNQLIGAQTASLAEAVTFGERAGLDREMLLTEIANSGFSSLVMAFRAALMKERKYEPAAFSSKLMLKDLRLALDNANGAGVAMPVTAQVAARYEQVLAQGFGDLDAAVVGELQDDR